MKIDVQDYFEVSEDELLETVEESFHALKAFTQSIEGVIESEREYEEPATTPVVIYRFKALYRYAVGRDKYSDDISQHMSQACSFAVMAEELSDSFESELAPGASSLKSVIIQAYARHKIDRFQGLVDSFVMDAVSSVFDEEDLDGMSILQLALLSRMKQQSVKNKLSTQSDYRLNRNHKGKHYMEIGKAVDWLKQQIGFTQPSETVSDDSNTISVPVSRDGSVFGVGNKGPKGFRVGPKGSEVVYPSFDEALNALKKMPTPYWRRPSKTSGVPGVVTGIRWERRPLAEITDA